MQKKYTTFTQQLKQNILRSFIVMLLLAIGAFSLGLVAYSRYTVENRANAFNEALSDAFEKNYHDYANQLYKMGSSTEIMNILDKKDNGQNMLYDYFQFNNEMEIKADLFLLDRDKKIVDSTLDDNQMNLHLRKFLEVVCDNAQMAEITTALYYLDETGRYLMCYPINGVSEANGYIIMMMKSGDWNYLLHGSQLDAVIVDRFNNVIASSQKKFIENNNKFRPVSIDNRFELEEARYYLSKHELKAYGVTIYTLALIDNQNQAILIGIIIILILGVSLILTAVKFTDQLAKNNSKSMNQLMDEMEHIKEDIHHQIKLDNEDEFSKLADGINSLIYEINQLHERNNELAQLRRQSEIKQLEAQFNPHFIYNTLDAIRYSILMDQRIASDLILQLTELLRYSINNELEWVHLGEDMAYIYKFLKIQKYRFNQRFNYEVDMDEQCMDYIIPKLMLQPLIENSIKYGFMKRASLNVKISGKVVNEKLTVIVEDDGAGMSKEEVDKVNVRMKSTHNEGNHQGLFNLARRLYLTYGEASSMHVESVENEYAKVIVTIDGKEHKDVSGTGM